MASEYKEISDLIRDYKEEIAKQEKDYRAITSPDFDPLYVEVEGFSRTDITYESIQKMLKEDSRMDETIIQIAFVNSCFERLQTAMVIIEAQTAWLARVDNILERDQKLRMERCIESDHYAVRGLYDQVMTLRTYQKDKKLPGKFTRDDVEYEVSEEDMMERLAQSSIEYRRINDGRLSQQFNALTTDQLVEKIFQARVDYAHIATEDIGLTLNKTHNAMREVLALKVAIDEGAILHEEFIQKFIDTSLNYADRRLKDAKYMLGSIEDFLQNIYYRMGYGDYGRIPYEVERNKAITFEPLDQLAP